jgi:hypothetical protein
MSNKANDFIQAGASWGNGLIQGFIDGIYSMAGNVQTAMENFTGWVGQYLPHSDAQKGELSKLTASGMAFADTFMSGIKAGGLDTIGNILQTPNIGSALPSLETITPASGNVVTVNNVYNISAKDGEDILAQLKQREKDLLNLIDRASGRINRSTY